MDQSNYHWTWFFSTHDHVFIAVKCADLYNRDQVLMKAVLVINLEVKDSHEEAAIGARLALDLCQDVRLLAS